MKNEFLVSLYNNINGFIFGGTIKADSRSQAARFAAERMIAANVLQPSDRCYAIVDYNHHFGMVFKEGKLFQNFLIQGKDNEK